MTPLWTGNSPPNTATGSAATRIAKEERSILDRRKASVVRRHRSPPTLYESRTSGSRHVTCSEVREETGDSWCGEEAHAYDCEGQIGGVGAD